MLVAARISETILDRVYYIRHVAVCDVEGILLFLVSLQSTNKMRRQQYRPQRIIKR